MEPSETFSAFANHVIVGNNLLEGTDILLDTSELQKKLTGNMSNFLASKLDRLRKAERDRIKEIDSFKEWMAEIVFSSAMPLLNSALATRTLSVLSSQQPLQSSSSFSNAYNSFFAPCLRYSTLHLLLQ